MSAEDPDFHRRDLWEAIAAGDAPEWRLEMQIMPFEEAADYRFNPFDLTKVWPHGDYPPITVGRMVLDRNPENHFAEVEQAGFSPANLVPGIGLSPDKMLMGRIFSYHDTHLHRIGANYEQLPVNAPRSPCTPTTRTADDLPPLRRPARLRAQLLRRADGRPELGSPTAGGSRRPRSAATPTRKHAEDDDFGQPGTLYREVMGDIDRDHLVDNIVGHAGDDVAPRRRSASSPTGVGRRRPRRSRRGGLGIDTGSANGDLAAAREEVFAHANHA